MITKAFISSTLNSTWEWASTEYWHLEAHSRAVYTHGFWSSKWSGILMWIGTEVWEGLEPEVTKSYLEFISTCIHYRIIAIAPHPVSVPLPSLYNAFLVFPSVSAPWRVTRATQITRKRDATYFCKGSCSISVLSSGSWQERTAWFSEWFLQLKATRRNRPPVPFPSSKFNI